MKEQPYRIRAHHGLCLSFFKGEGYSSEFIENMTNIKSRLEKNPLVCIISQTDLICAICPHNNGEVCAAGEKIREYDRQVLTRCNIAEGEIMPFLELEGLVRRNILLPGKRKEVCGDCQWNELCH
ncbi:MAG: DUF1284 domain-containing protein [Lachnospiraceae bacterium]|nr:DUF1284 domain-containing protein [Lachnospiraceae bacterium]MDD7027069.1 DUF1284 domain-containing protein [Lachnospiraceae bacterium]